MADLTLLKRDSYHYFGNVFQQQWGIFKNGVPVVTADSVVSFEYKQEWALSDFPVEQGGFASYDKVHIPFDVRFRFSSGGSEANRSRLLSAIQAIAGTLTLFDAASPEAIYIGCNIKHYDYRRTSVNGVGMIQIDVWLEEVQQVQSSTTGGASASAPSAISPSAPSGADPFNNGTIQPLPLNAASSGAPNVTPGNPIGTIGSGAGLPGGNAGNLGFT